MDVKRRFESGDAVVDMDGVVHRVRWAPNSGDEDFTIYCQSQLFLVYSAFFKPSDQNVSCLRCLAEAG